MPGANSTVQRADGKEEEGKEDKEETEQITYDEFGFKVCEKNLP